MDEVGGRFAVRIGQEDSRVVGYKDGGSAGEIGGDGSLAVEGVGELEAQEAAGAEGAEEEKD